MALHRLDYPTITAPTRTIYLNPADVVIQPFRVFPVQQRLVSEDATAYVVQRSALRLRFLDMQIRDSMPEYDLNGEAGMLTVIDFVDTTLNFAMRTCDLTDTDGDRWRVRFWSNLDTIVEATGDIQLAKFYGASFVWLVENV